MFQSTVDALTIDELKEAIAAEGLESCLTDSDRQELEHIRLKFIYLRGGLREMEEFVKEYEANLLADAGEQSALR